jgi:hypothetical protein
VSGVVFAVLFILVTVVMVSIGFAMTSAPANATVVQGRITSISVNDRGLCSPVAEFFVDGVGHTAHAAVAQQPCPWHVGDTIAVSYLPGSAETTARALVSTPIWLPLIGVLFLGCGLYVGITSIRKLVFLRSAPVTE